MPHLILTAGQWQWQCGIKLHHTVCLTCEWATSGNHKSAQWLATVVWMSVTAHWSTHYTAYSWFLRLWKVLEKNFLF